MQDDSSAHDSDFTYPGERVVFWRHMAFRMFVGVWALLSVIFDPASKAFVTLLVLACFYGMGETVFASLAVFARYRAIQDEKKKREEEIRLARQAMAAAQAASAEKYFDLGKDGKAVAAAGGVSSAPASA